MSDFLIQQQIIVSTHPSFRHLEFDQCNAWGLYPTPKTNNEVGDMLLEIGMLELINDFPNSGDLTLEELNNKIPEDYNFANNAQKPQMKMIDIASFYLQKYRYPGELTTHTSVKDAINALIYMGGEKILQCENSPRELISLFHDPLIDSQDEQETHSDGEEE